MQCSWQWATGRRYHLSIIPTPSLPRAVRHGSTCTWTNCIPATVAQGGWCSTSSLLLALAVARLITTCQALNLDTDKTRHSPSSDRKESSNSMQPDLRYWDLRHLVLSLMHNIAGLLTWTPISGKEQQHRSSVKRTFSILSTLSDITPLWTVLGLQHSLSTITVYLETCISGRHLSEGLYHETLVLGRSSCKNQFY